MILPNLIIGGCHKSGTTSIYNYLRQHPKVDSPNIKEIHYYTPLRYGKKINDLNFYSNFFEGLDINSEYLLDASPSYLYGGEIIKDKIYDDLKSPKIIFCLRNPVDRLISYFKKRVLDGSIRSDTDFLDFSKKSKLLSLDIEVDNPINRAYREGLYYIYLSKWVDKRDDIILIFFDDIVNNSQKVMKNLSEKLNIDSSFYDNFNFAIHNKSFQPKSGLLHTFASKLNRFSTKFISRNSSIKKLLRKNYLTLNKSERTLKINNYYAGKSFLFESYSKENEKLRSLLKNKFQINKMPSWL